MAEHGLSINRSCLAVRMSRASYYTGRANPLNRDGDVIEALQLLVFENRRWGFWKCYDSLRLNGRPWNHKRVYRVYHALGLNQARRTKKRLPTRERQSMDTIAEANQTWAMDFVSDSLYNGRRFRTFNILDEGVREVIAIEIDSSLPAERIIRTMEQIKSWRGLPRAIRCDNGPEFIAQSFSDWCKANDIELRYIQPGKPNQNAFIERFNRTYRNEVLDSYLFEDLDQVREVTHEWIGLYNERRPHDSLGGIPPSMYRTRLENKKLYF